MQISRPRKASMRVVVGGRGIKGNPAQVVTTRRSGGKGRSNLGGYYPTPKDPRVYPTYPVSFDIEQYHVAERVAQAGRGSRRGVPITQSVEAFPIDPLVQRTGYDTYPASASIERLTGARKMSPQGLGLFHENITIPGTDITLGEMQDAWPKLKEALSVMTWLPARMAELKGEFDLGAGSSSQRDWWSNEASPKWTQITSGWDKVTALYDLVRQNVPGLSGGNVGLNQDRRPLAIATRKQGLGVIVTATVIIIIALVIALAVVISKFSFDAISGGGGENVAEPPVSDTGGGADGAGGPGGPGARGKGYGPGINNMFWFKAGPVGDANPNLALAKVAEPDGGGEGRGNGNGNGIANFSDKPKIHAWNNPNLGVPSGESKIGGGRVVFSNPEMEVREYVEGEAATPLARSTGKRIEEPWWVTPGWDADVPLVNDEWERFGGSVLNGVLIGVPVIIGVGLLLKFAGGVL